MTFGSEKARVAKEGKLKLLATREKVQVLCFSFDSKEVEKLFGLNLEEKQ